MLLTKSMRIVTPQVLGIIVAVAPRLISYRIEPQDHIVQECSQIILYNESKTRSYRTLKARRDCIIQRASMRGKKMKESMQSNVSAYSSEVQM